MYPILTTLFPPANDSDRADSRPGKGLFHLRPSGEYHHGFPYAACIAATDPIASRCKSLSTGAKAGIGVGVGLGVILLLAVALAWFIVSRRRKKRKAEEALKMEEEEKRKVESEQQANDYAEAKAPMLDGQTRYEMSGTGRRPELDGTGYAELEASGISELEGSSLRDLR